MSKLKSVILIFLLAVSTPSKAAYLELALVLDGSGSIGSSDYQLQLYGYQNALSSGSFYTDYIANSIYDGVYLSAWQFPTSTVMEANWTRIDSDAAATDFGNLFNTSNMPQTNGMTGTAAVIDIVTDSLLSTFGIDNIDDAMVIDISTDGYPDSRPDALAAANNARDNNVTINAIGVGNGIGTDFLEDLVAEGSGDDHEGFYLTASDFDSFSDTLETKLVAEVIGPIETPEPSSIGIVGLGLLCLGSFIRRYKKR